MSADMKIERDGRIFVLVSFGFLLFGMKKRLPPKKNVP